MCARGLRSGDRNIRVLIPVDVQERIEDIAADAAEKLSSGVDEQTAEIRRLRNRWVDTGRVPE